MNVVQESGKTVWKKALILFFICTLYPLPYTLIYAETEISVVEKPFMEGRYERAVLEAHRLIDGRARQRQEVYYLKGLSELKLNKFNEARQSFEAIIAKYPRSNRVFDAHIGIGDSYLLAGDTENAARIYTEVKEKFPSDRNIAIVDSRLNDCCKKSAPVEDKKEAVQSGEAKGYISIQAGCFKSKRNADKLSTRLSSAGYQSYVELPLTAGDRLYRVKVGRFKSKGEAESLAAKMNRDGYKTKICDDISCQ